MTRPPQRLADGKSLHGKVEDRAAELLGSLRSPPRLDPAADARLERRIAEVASGPRTSQRRWFWLAVPAALAVTFFAVEYRQPPTGQEGRARGSRHATALTPATPLPQLLPFRIREGGGSEPLGNVIARHDELAFAYRTDGTDRRVLVFARDQNGRVYWYHPAWTSPSENPEAVPLSRQAGTHELPAAVSHSFQGNEVEICAVFTSEPLRAREAEQQLSSGRLNPDCRKVAVEP